MSEPSVADSSIGETSDHIATVPILPEGRAGRVWMYVFLVAAAGLAAVRWHSSSQASAFQPVAARKPMSAVSLPQLGGGQWVLADHLGQIVLINYWATWCEPCQEELPGLKQIARQSNPAAFAMVGVSLDAGPNAEARVQQFATRYRIPYAIAFAGATGLDQAVLVGIPKTLLLDRHGRVARTYLGPVNQQDIARDIAALLSET
jgi:cytochrome c biogenesis protein CcmG, thiol:disulfide interchange protein DsbE